MNVIDFVTIASTGDATDFGDMPEVRLGFPSALANEVRGVVCLGETTPSGNLDDLDFVTISSTGNAVAFGEGYASAQQSTAGGSTTRGIYCGGKAPGFKNNIDFITIMSTGNGTDFGDLTDTTGGGPRGQSSNATRMLMYGGSNPSSDHVNSITFLTIATLGNSVDFGDISADGLESFRVTTSSTRGVTAGGYISPTFTNVMEYITIASKGDSQDFGDYSLSRYAPAHTGNSVRGIIAGGYTPSAQSDIDYYTIATLGNTVDFGGDLPTSSGGAMGSGSDPTRACMFGTNTNSNVIQYIQIASTGIDGSDFGDLTGVCTNVGGFSNTHGGL